MGVMRRISDSSYDDTYCIGITYSIRATRYAFGNAPGMPGIQEIWEYITYTYHTY